MTVRHALFQGAPLTLTFQVAGRAPAARPAQSLEHLWAHLAGTAVSKQWRTNKANMAGDTSGCAAVSYRV